MKEYLNKHSEQLYEYVLNERYSKAPRHIQAMLKRIVLDTFGAIIAGTEAPVSHITRDVVNAQYTPGRCTVIGQKDKLAIVGRLSRTGPPPMLWIATMATDRRRAIAAPLSFPRYLP